MKDNSNATQTQNPDHLHVTDPSVLPPKSTIVTHIQHLTISTGHLYSSPRNKVPTKIITRLRPLVKNGVSKIPGTNGYRVMITLVSGGAIFTVLAPVCANLSDGPLVTCFLSIDGTESKALWQHAQDLHHDCTNSMNLYRLAFGGVVFPSMPHGPWLAVLLMPTLALSIEAAKWLGDFERCLAWAIIDELSTGKAA